MSKDLNRVESAVSATASGNLTWEKWPYDTAVALGLSGQKNPLGFAMVRWLGDQTSLSVWGVVLALSTLLIRRGVDAKASNELAFQAFEFWNHMHCPDCAGRGVTGIEQGTCPACGGSGDRPISHASAAIRDGVSLLIEAEQWMEGQLATRLKSCTYEASDDGYKVNLPRLSGTQDIGLNVSPQTGFRGHHDSD
ncbi:MAG: hypothetical protein H6R18_1926 [Proteobacteria bacterium]|nr:hypothetical protein [Pseudomonadota bacterium]